MVDDDENKMMTVWTRNSRGRRCLFRLHDMATTLAQNVVFLGKQGLDNLLNHHSSWYPSDFACILVLGFWRWAVLNKYCISNRAE
jgi:hypothetical protein